MKRQLILIPLLATLVLQAQVGINTDSPKSSLHIKRDTKVSSEQVQGLTLPHFTQSERNSMKKEDLQKSLMIWNDDKQCIDWWDGKHWQCTDGSNKDNHGDAPLRTNITIPPDVELGGGRRVIVSIYDNDYIPYSKPTAAASWDRTVQASRADGTNEAKLIDVQGKIPMSGISIRIPITVTGSGSKVIPAFRQQIEIPAEKVEDNVSRKLELSWSATTVGNTDEYITATLKSLEGDLNVKKLDVNSGIGLRAEGLELAKFNYPSTNAGTVAEYEVRAISGIPDRAYNVQTHGRYEHMFIYVPVEGPDGKIWLNNNLGANYSNVESADFDPVNSGTSYNDVNAFGSLFQWNRNSDGHELMIWDSNKAENTPDKGVPAYLNSYVKTPRQSRRWSASTNPCPPQYRVPLTAELYDLSLREPQIMLPFPGYMHVTSKEHSLFYSGESGHYWGAEAPIQPASDAAYFMVTYTDRHRGANYAHYGMSVRCIME